MAEAQGVVRTYYALTGLFNLSASLIWGVNTLFLLDAGLTILQAFTANAAFTAGQVLFEVPTGVVADTRGRRLSFLLSAGTLLVGTLAYVYLADYAGGPSFVWWLAASVLLGLGFTFYTGAVEAWFVDAYRASGGTGDLDPIFARSAQVFGVSMLVGTVTGGLLGHMDLSLPYVVRSGLLGLLLVVGALLMHDIGFNKRPFRARHVPQEVTAIARASWQHGWRQRPVRLLMMISFLHMGFLIWGWYAWQPYFLELLGKDLVWVAGVIAALVSFFMIAGNQLITWLHGRLPRTMVLIIGAAGLAVCMIGVGLAPGFYTAVGLFLLGMVFFGITGPAKQAALHRLIPTEQRATIVSFDGLLASAGGVGSQIVLARVAQDKGYAAGYVIGGVVLTLAVPLAWRFRQATAQSERGKGQPTDRP